jgi:hypothetical protein
MKPVKDIASNAPVYCFDIDGCLCTTSPDGVRYAEPIKSRIAVVNGLKMSGATIYLQTARGMITANNNQQEADADARELTENQLKEWGVEYDQLFFGKPRAMHYIDDRGWNDGDFFRQF